MSKLPNHVLRNARKEGQFGPPLYDESTSSYRWRIFKKGFSWGFMLTSTILYQYSYYTFLSRPAQYTKKQLMTMPLILALACGTGMGVIDVVSNPQRTYKT